MEEYYIDDLEFETIELTDSAMLRECASQVANSTFHTIIALIFLVLGFKLLKHSPVPNTTRVYVHIAVTSFIVGWFNTEKLLTALIFNVFSLISLKCAHKRISGYVVLAVNIFGLIALQLMCQYHDYDDYFLSIRGVLMMHIMRLATVAFQMDRSTIKNMRFSQFANFIEYVYYPPFITFGPYLTYDQFFKMLQKRWTGHWYESGTGLKSTLFIFIGVFFATVSTCSYEIYTPTSQFVEDAITAMSFRQSHYFVCFVAQAFIVFLGSDAIIVNPFNIEFARSPLQVVSEWNKPFHTFLHEYVFQRRFFNSTGLNVLLTFVVSSLLHGLDFQMTITLLALGFIAYAETVFRKRLATRFSMCIAAKPCKIVNGRHTCNHRQALSGRAAFINTLFAILSMYHLVFTGMAFTDDYAANGYPVDHAISIWRTHHYASLVISVVFLGLSKIL